MSNKTVIVADDTAFVRDRFATALVGRRAQGVTVKSAAELLAHVREDLARLDLLVLDLRLPHAGGVELVRAIRKIDGGRLPILVFSGTIASARRGQGPGGAGGRRLRERVQRGAEHPAVAGAAPLPRQLQPPRQPARRPRHPGGLPLRQHDRGRADAEPEQGRRGDPDDEPARAARQGPRAVPAARIEGGRGGRVAASPGATAASAWACSSRRSKPPTSARSTSSSISISLPTGRPEVWCCPTPLAAVVR